jgi:hypothetical protein
MIVAAFLLSGCPGADETWALVQLLTKGEQRTSALQITDVRNCNGLPEKKTVACSAGTDSSLSISVGGSVLVGIVGTVDPSVATELGFSRTSGQDLELETPPPGFIAQYRIITDYRVVSGRGLARSSTGREQEIAYKFQADCALRIDSRELMSCEAEDERPPSTVAVLPATVQPSRTMPPVTLAANLTPPAASTGSAPSVVPSSMPTPITTTVIQAPEQAVKDYYTAINNRQYEGTWATLTPHFKDVFNCCTPSGQHDFDGYRAWWESVEKVEVGRVATVDRGNDTATVYAELTYRLKNGRTILDSKPYIKLLFDTVSDRWSFDDKGPYR